MIIPAIVFAIAAGEVIGRMVASAIRGGSSQRSSYSY